jgi:hypothetical protein
MHMQICTEENMTTTFSDFAKGFWDKPASKPRSTTPKPTVTADSEPQRRQLRGQMTDIVQELHNLPELTDTDHRVLNISRAVAFLLEGR